MPEFAPWANGGRASRNKDGSITGTLALKAGAGLRIASAEIHGDGTFLTVHFTKVEVEE